MQLILHASNTDAVKSSLGQLGASSEIFVVSTGLVGLSVPTKVVDDLGEDLVMDLVSQFPNYELWSGAWREPAPPHDSQT